MVARGKSVLNRQGRPPHPLLPVPLPLPSFSASFSTSFSISFSGCCSLDDDDNEEEEVVAAVVAVAMRTRRPARRAQRCSSTLFHASRKRETTDSAIRKTHVPAYWTRLAGVQAAENSGVVVDTTNVIVIDMAMLPWLVLLDGEDGVDEELSSLGFLVKSAISVLLPWEGAVLRLACA